MHVNYNMLLLLLFHYYCYYLHIGLEPIGFLEAENVVTMVIL